MRENPYYEDEEEEEEPPLGPDDCFHKSFCPSILCSIF
jgi:hypothetical protein